MAMLAGVHRYLQGKLSRTFKVGIGGDKTGEDMLPGSQPALG